MTALPMKIGCDQNPTDAQDAQPRPRALVSPAASMQLCGASLPHGSPGWASPPAAWPGARWLDVPSINCSPSTLPRAFQEQQAGCMEHLDGAEPAQLPGGWARGGGGHRDVAAQQLGKEP